MPTPTPPDAPPPNTQASSTVARDRLWAGVGFKISAARYHLDEMNAALTPPALRGNSPGHAFTAGVVTSHVLHRWHDRFYFNLDALLVALRSVPEIIAWTFGTDGERHDNWLRTLAGNEAVRRQSFQAQFAVARAALPSSILDEARNIAVHRAGFPPVRVAILGHWGTTYVGGPTSPMPQLEAPSFSEAGNDAARPPAPAFAAGLPLEPRADDFVVSWHRADGSVHEVPLFTACGARLRSMQCLVDEARAIVNAVHCDDVISDPPLSR